jgi:hypothetical protein
VHESRWLQRLAAKLDPLPRPPTRQGRWRQRQRNGCSIYRVELHVAPVIEALIRSQRLTEADTLQHEQVERALAAGLFWTVSRRTFARPT